MFKDAIDQMKDDEYIDKLHRQISGLENDIEMVDQQNLSILKTAEKFKRKSEKLEQQNKRYQVAIEELNKIYDKEKSKESDGLNYKEGYLDGLDRAIGFLEALESNTQ